MNVPYLLLGLICGLAIGYVFGWQERRDKLRLKVRGGIQIKRMSGWSDARYIEELEGLVHALLRDRAKLAQVSRVVADCAGPSPCTNCPEKRRCAAVGCIRLSEQCDPPMGFDTKGGAA